MLKFYRQPIVLVTFVLSFFPVFLPILFGQDLPQHLAYGKFIAEIVFKKNVFFSDAYVLSPNFQGYHFFHWVMALLNLLTNDAILSYRLYLFAWTLFFHWSFYQVLRVFVADEKKHAMLYPLGLFALWNGTYLLGFTPFSFGLPVFWYLVARAKERSLSDKKEMLVQLFLTVSTGLFHSILMLFSLLVNLAFVYWKTKGLKKPATPNYPLVACYGLTSLVTLFFLGGFYGGDMVREALDLVRAYNVGWGFEIVTVAFKADWSSPPSLLNYFFWQWGGPWRLLFLLFVLLAEGGAIFYLRKNFDFEFIKKFKISFWLLLVTLVVPWAIYWPTEITFINYRFMTMLLPFLLLGLFGSLKQDFLFVPAVKGLFFGLAFLIACLLNQQEARPALDLVEQIPAGKKVGSLINNGKSDFFAHVYDQNHFLPMYYSIKREGLNSQFWGRYTGHLPVGAKPGREVPMTADWRPQDFKPDDLKQLDYLLVNFTKENQHRLMNYLSNLMERRACYRDWCLFAK